jgi:flagellar hook-basal body complex protein FliE
MTAPFIPPIGAIQEPAFAVPLAQPLAGSTAPAPTSFGDLVTGGLQKVSEQLNASQADLQGLATGNVENLHQVMLRLEESRMSFQLMLQVRNRLLESYQELMRMQL